MDGKWGDYIALLGLVNILDILVAVVSSLGEEGLNMIYPNVIHSKEEAHFDSIAFLGYDAESHFHSLQPMDAKKPDVAEELNLKHSKGGITEDEICPKCGKKISQLFQ